ncbi:methyl-accepting chemotaxis protein [Fundidesulfovibrio agrisoli]|uniref:methyl-accepting chemotaxis protein n=1 Tax=Fundidesulfovibrio agrisoli TaxID=2922717 RepID=UPI001FAC8D6C|nr:methyl-accepting chemotaxis protein [Fundidesulfovibrio agrisoli]
MNLFRDVSIFIKLVSGFLSLVALTLVIVVSNHYVLSGISNDSAEVAAVWSPAMAVSADMSRAANDFRRAEFRYILSDTEAERSKAMGRIAKAKQTLEAAEAKLVKLALTKDCTDLLRQFSAKWKEFLPVSEKVVQLATSGKREEASVLMSGDSSKRFNEAMDSLDKLTELTQTHGLQNSSKVVSDAEKGEFKVLVLSIAVVILGLGAALLLPRRITRRLRATQHLAESVAAGNLAACVEVDSEDELGKLQKSILDMLCKIKEEMSFATGVLKGFTVPCSVFSKEDTTLFTNQLMVDLIERGGKPEDYTGQTSGGFIWGDSKRETLSTKALREGRTLTTEMDFTTHKGSKRHARISSAPFSDEQGNILGTISVWMDLTAIKEQEELIASQQEQLLKTASDAELVAEAVSSASEELSAQVEQASRGADMQRGRAAETATAMEEMNATVTEVARNAQAAAQRSDSARTKAQEGMSVVKEVIASMEQVRSQALSLKDRMASLEDRALSIGRILNVITDIADQTNLLALNAAIEAARAGDAGRGFAVVADEVRKLAEKTMAATHEVESSISGIQNEAKENMANVDATAQFIDKVTRLAETSGESLEEIVNLADTTSLEVHNIATAAEQQSAASGEINSSVADINRISEETAQTMAHSADAVADLANQAGKLQRVIAGMRGGGATAALGM